MDLKKCTNGHYYDGEKYQICPHCITFGRVQPENNPNEMSKSKLLKEFKEVYLQTFSSPIGCEEQAWNWVMERLQYFNKNGLERNELLLLEKNILFHMTDYYAEHIEEFLDHVEDIQSIISVCEMPFMDPDPSDIEKNVVMQIKKAKEVAEPFMDYLLSHEDKYDHGQLYFQSETEHILYKKEYPDQNMIMAEDNYTLFILFYCRIMDMLLISTPEEAENRKLQKERCLNIAKRISPCNADVWLALADNHFSDAEIYHSCIDKALQYATRRDCLGAIYASLALYYTISNPQLAGALCSLSNDYGGNTWSVKMILMKAGFTANDAEYEKKVRDAGIQIGFSELSDSAMMEIDTLRPDQLNQTGHPWLLYNEIKKPDLCAN